MVAAFVADGDAGVSRALSAASLWVWPGFAVVLVFVALAALRLR